MPGSFWPRAPSVLIIRIQYCLRIEPTLMLLKGSRTPIVRDMGGFIVHPNMPGWLTPKTRDHGHGPLAMIVESVLHPGRLVALHEHQNDEIVSWVPDGVMRHDDKVTGRFLQTAGI